MKLIPYEIADPSYFKLMYEQVFEKVRKDKFTLIEGSSPVGTYKTKKGDDVIIYATYIDKFSFQAIHGAIFLDGIDKQPELAAWLEDGTFARDHEWSLINIEELTYGN